jgi:hypothetical protein
MKKKLNLYFNIFLLYFNDLTKNRTGSPSLFDGELKILLTCQNG